MARAAEVIGGEHRVPALSILDQACLYYAIARHTVLVMAALALDVEELSHCRSSLSVRNARLINSCAQMTWICLAWRAWQRGAEAPGILLCSSLGTAGVSDHRLIRVRWPRLAPW